MTDTDNLLWILRKWTPGTWVPLDAILSESFALYGHGLTVHSRVADLRKRGHTVQNRTEHVNGRVRSFYRLVTP